MDEFKIINRLEENIEENKKFGENSDVVSWSHEKGVLISGNEAKLFIKLLKKTNTNDEQMENKKYNVDVPVWADIPVIVYAKNKVEAFVKAKEIVFIGGNGELKTTKLLFDHDRFNGGKLYNHRIDNFVKELNEKKVNGDDK